MASKSADGRKVRIKFLKRNLSAQLKNNTGVTPYNDKVKPLDDTNKSTATNMWNLTGGTGNVNNNNRNNNYVVRAVSAYNGLEYPISLESLFEAYFHCRKNKRNSRQSIEFELQYETNLVELWEEIKSGNYKISSSEAFIVNYPVKREIFAANFRDRIIHHWIALRLEPLFEKVFIEDSYNCRIGKGTSYAVKRVTAMIKEETDNYTKSVWVLKLDIKGFFMSIDKDIMWSKIQNIIDSSYHEDDVETLLFLTKKTVYNRPEANCIFKSPASQWRELPRNKSLFFGEKTNGMAIGNLTSQLFANFYLAEFDSWMMSKGIKYGRYVDDLLIIDCDKNKLKGLLEEIKLKFKELNLVVHPNKIYLQQSNKGVKYIGVVFKHNRNYISNRTVGHCHDAINNFNKIEKKQDTVVKFTQSINSYFGTMINYSSYNVRKRLMLMVDTEWFQYVYFINGRKVRIKKNKIMNSIGALAENSPLELINGWYIIRYGYEPVKDTEGVFTFVEHRFKTKPTIERIQSLVDQYNQSTGKSVEIDEADYQEATVLDTI